MKNIKFKTSRRWDCIFSLQELIENNKTCIIDRREQRSHTYIGPVVYLKIPKRTMDYIEVGILDDGFYYRADCRFNEETIIGDICDTKDALEEMYLYRLYNTKKSNNIHKSEFNKYN